MVFQKLIFDFCKIYGIIIMKDEKVWDYSICNIGHPCTNCIKECTFRLDKGADEKEKENERIAKEFKGTAESN